MPNNTSHPFDGVLANVAKAAKRAKSAKPAKAAKLAAKPSAQRHASFTHLKQADAPHAAVVPKLAKPMSDRIAVARSKLEAAPPEPKPGTFGAKVAAACKRAGL